MALPANSSRASSSAQGFDVEVVRRLVEHQHVAALGQGLRQVQAAALTARQVAHELRWSRPEVEAADGTGAARHDEPLPTVMLSRPPETSSQTVVLPSRLSRLWSTKARRAVWLM